jgi:Tfp pilus assembly protein PilZ
VGDLVGLTFCPVCGGSHSKPEDCPGELRATGSERHGWRVSVETPYGIEAYGVLVAPSFDLWRSRIITYPNVLWTAPGGAVTLKFAGRTPQDAEAQAVAFVEGHIRARGYVRRDGLDFPAVSKIQAEAAAKAQAGKDPALRKLRALPVQFGAGPALFAAMTGNISESGLFVITLAPFDPGTDLRVLIDLDTGPMGLKGKVVWKRERMVLGRPVGMGVQLIAPPEPYRDFVLELP